MHSRSALLPLALAVGLVTASPAVAAGGGGGPVAHAAGGDLPPIIPSLIQTRVRRTEKALERLDRYVDNQESAKVVKVSKVIRRQTAAAWRGAKYYLRNPPPPVAEDRSTAQLGEDGALPVVADQYATAIFVFDLVHGVSADALELTDGAHGDTLSALSRTMFWTLNKRNAMVEDAHLFDTPAEPPEDRRGSRRLKQDEEAVGFAPLMPLVTQELDDELQHVAGLLTDATDLRPRGRTILGRARTQIQATGSTINTYWPAVPAED